MEIGDFIRNPDTWTHSIVGFFRYTRDDFRELFMGFIHLNKDGSFEGIIIDCEGWSKISGRFQRDHRNALHSMQLTKTYEENRNSEQPTQDLVLAPIRYTFRANHRDNSWDGQWEYEDEAGREAKECKCWTNPDTTGPDQHTIFMANRLKFQY